MKIRPAGFQKSVFLAHPPKKLNVVFSVGRAPYLEAVDFPKDELLQKFFQLVVFAAFKIRNYWMRPNRNAPGRVYKTDSIFCAHVRTLHTIPAFIREIPIKTICLFLYRV